MSFNNLSVIIPVAAQDNQLANLITDLCLLSKNTEIIFVGTSYTYHRWQQKGIFRPLKYHHYRWLASSASRAQALNVGARHAKNTMLWFLHADSRFSTATLLALQDSIACHPDALHYFQLKFLNDGPKWMCINEWFAKLRAHWFKLPFGDQGLCLSKKTFYQLGEFYDGKGEDHLLVWQAKVHKVAFAPIRAPLLTSARAYQHNWLKNTLKNQCIWIPQAIKARSHIKRLLAPIKSAP